MVEKFMIKPREKKRDRTMVERTAKELSLSNESDPAPPTSGMG